MSICAVVGASPECNLEHFASHSFDYCIAVDGGYEHILSCGREADIVMGDFDSLGYVPRHARMVQFPVEKDFSDMERALQRALQRKPDEIWVYGALGGRLDHSLCNIQVAAGLAEQGAYVRLIGMQECMRFIAGPDVMYLPQRESGLVTVLALSDRATGVLETGLKYEVMDKTVSNRKAWGLSNEFIGEEACIALSDGCLGIVYDLEEDTVLDHPSDTPQA